eukprot:1586059-Pyramimonas_sp.AAC.1
MPRLPRFATPKRIGPPPAAHPLWCRGGATLVMPGRPSCIAAILGRVSCGCPLCGAHVVDV